VENPAVPPWFSRCTVGCTHRDASTPPPG